MVSAVLASVVQSARSAVDSIFSFIRAQGDTDYLGEAVSQLEQHSLQAADLAKKAGADEETVLATLLYDIGIFLPDASKHDAMIASDGTRVGTAGHEVLGENYLRSVGFSDKVAQLVGAHVMAKRYLAAVDPAYFDGLSAASKRSLVYQGGKFSPEEVKAAEKDPLLQQKLAVRRWDNQAKVTGAKVPDLESYKNLAVESSRRKVTLHSRSYIIPRRPTVVICVDGFDPSYLQKGIEDGIIPTLSSFVNKGFHETAEVAMPSFTNPNNVSIITGVPPAIHGIAGNYFLDREAGKDIMIVDDTLLRGSTILEQMSNVGVRIAAVTAKDKLRKILTHGLTLGKGNSVCFSSEKAASCTLEENGISDVEKLVGRPQPPQFSGELSLFVLDAGIKLLEQDRADLFYLTLSDFIQHTHAPREKESDDFYAALDARIARLVELGAKVAISGDHGMNGKCSPDGKPDVFFLQDELRPDSVGALAA
ncbi:alkaline phosphatase-like protein [Mytilinidion resinicola]|uniref:Alkaline phosphatase-like protein n=1 Tax=Mytilinidion resinicola TaxID=574789 RepID=A0A6A6Z571_9PEZI|nr:alkaline phosphatase-like protein [Mytilinidion resinicola]KAF2816272.1 alkaline phosphatase-like protein [Mytilinidion resinicola]